MQDGENTSDLTPYESDLERLKADTLKGISNPEARAKFEMDMDLQAAQTRTKIKTIMWTRVKEKSIANMNTTIEYLTNEYAQTGDKSTLEAMNSNIDTYVKAGIIGADDAQKVKVKATSEAKENAFITAYRNNPTEAENNLKTNVWEMNTETLAKAEGKLKSLQNEVREQQKNNAYDMWERLHAGTLTIQEIVAAKNNGGVNGIGKPEAKNLETSLYARLNKSVESLYTSNDRARKYIDIVNKIENDRDKYSRFQTILASFADGSLSKDESTQLNNLIGKQEGSFDLIKSGINAIKNWASQIPGLSLNILAPAFNNYFNRVANAGLPQQAAKKAIEQATVEHNPNKIRYKIGDTITNPKTRRNAKITGFKADGTPILQMQ